MVSSEPLPPKGPFRPGIPLAVADKEVGAGPPSRRGEHPFQQP